MEEEPRQPQLYNETERITKCKNKPELLSLNEIYQENVGSHCGYCDKEDTSFSWSFTKKKMEPYTYELLMERGWRRCGTYYYKPNLQKSCCKLFTHRQEVAKFKPKRDQKKAIKRVISLAYQKIQEIQQQKPNEPEKQTKHKNHKQPKQIEHKEKHIVPEITTQAQLQLEAVCNHILMHLEKILPTLLTNLGILNHQTQLNFDLAGKLKFFTSKPEEKWHYYSNFVMLLYGINKKIFNPHKHSLLDFAKEVKPTIEDLNPISNFRVEVERGGYLLFKNRELTHQFQILGEKEEQKAKEEIMVPEQSSEENCSGFAKIISTIKNKLKGEVPPESKQNPVHQPKLQDHNSNKFQILKPELNYKGEINISHNKITFGKISIDIVPAEQSVQSFKMYQLYCEQIHEKQEKTLSSYVNFLCLQALEYKQQHSNIDNQLKEQYLPAWDPTAKHQKAKPVQGETKKMMGCYHMKYYFKGKLIGVGVIDIVNDGLSSVYFFYDPAYKEYRLGVFSSLIEIEYIRWMRLSFPQFRYYYMGFYISNSEKMNYKVDYMPCQLLCPITYHFVDFTEEIKAKVERIDRKEETDLRLAPKEQKPLDDMHFGKDVGPYIDKTLKLMYNGRKLVLKQINPHFFVHILKILKVNVPVWGKTLFDIFTFTV